MAKVKRMMFGGAAKAAAGAVKSVGAKAAPPKSAPPPAFPAKSGVGNAAAALRRLPMNPPRPGTAGPRPMQSAGKAASAADAYKAYNAQKSGNMGTGSQAAKTGLGDAMRGLGAANNVARGISRSDLKMAGLMKKGGAVKKAIKK